MCHTVRILLTFIRCDKHFSFTLELTRQQFVCVKIREYSISLEWDSQICIFKGNIVVIGMSEVIPNSELIGSTLPVLLDNSGIKHSLPETTMLV